MARKPNSTKECVENVDHSRVLVSEKGRAATILNPERSIVRRILIDNCLITMGPRCDWVISVKDRLDILIELKGKDVSHAVDQLAATLAIWQEHHLRDRQIPISALVVCSRYPRFDTKIQKAKERLARDYKVPLHVSTRNEEYLCSDLRKFSPRSRV